MFGLLIDYNLEWPTYIFDYLHAIILYYVDIGLANSYTQSLALEYMGCNISYIILIIIDRLWPCGAMGSWILWVSPPPPPQQKTHQKTPNRLPFWRTPKLHKEGGNKRHPHVRECVHPPPPPPYWNPKCALNPIKGPINYPIIKIEKWLRDSPMLQTYMSLNTLPAWLYM